MCYRIGNITRKRIISARVIISREKNARFHSEKWKSSGRNVVAFRRLPGSRREACGNANEARGQGLFLVLSSR